MGLLWCFRLCGLNFSYDRTVSAKDSKYTMVGVVNDSQTGALICGKPHLRGHCVGSKVRSSPPAQGRRGSPAMLYPKGPQYSNAGYVGFGYLKR